MPTFAAPPPLNPPIASQTPLVLAFFPKMFHICNPGTKLSKMRGHAYILTNALNKCFLPQNPICYALKLPNFEKSSIMLHICNPGTEWSKIRGHIPIFWQMLWKSVFYPKIPFLSPKTQNCWTFSKNVANLQSWNKMKQNDGSYTYILTNVLKSVFRPP